MTFFTPNPSRKLARQAIAALLVLGVTSCAYTAGVTKRYETRRLLDGSARAGDGARVPVIEVDNDALLHGLILKGRVVLVADGTETSEVSAHVVQRVVPYTVLDATIGRVVFTPLYFVVLGPLWTTRGDTDGDGRTSAGERLRFTLVMLNPFEAMPVTPKYELRDTVTATRQEAAPTKVRVGSVPGRVDVLVAGREHRLTRATDADSSGAFELPLASTLASVAGDPTTIQITAADGAASTTVGPLPADSFVGALSEAGQLRDLTPTRREALARVLRRDAADKIKESRSSAIEAYKRALALAGSPRAGREPANGEKVLLTEALKRGTVTVRASGRGTNYVGLELTAAGSVTVRVLAGTYFPCRSGAQDMISTEDVDVTVWGHERKSIAIPAACANMHRRTPLGGDVLSVDARSQSEDLVRVAPYLGAVTYPVRQAAVWIVTDDADRSDFASYRSPSIGDADILEAVALLQIAGVDVSHRRIHQWVLKK